MKDFNGVVISKIIEQPKGQKWVVVYTPEGKKGVRIEEMKTVACSTILNIFSAEQKQKLLNWLDRGANPKFSVEDGTEIFVDDLEPNTAWIYTVD